jgi:hypothetical protein
MRTIKYITLLLSLALSNVLYSQALEVHQEGRVRVRLDAGDDITITTLDSILLSATTKNVDSLVWRTDGTGTITDSTAARTYYTPSLEDYLLDSITVDLLGFTMSGKDTLYTGFTIYNSLPSINFTSVQPATLDQVTAVFKTAASTDTVYLYWGEDDIVKICGTSDQTITSDYSTNNTIYNIKMFGNLDKLTKFSISSETTLSGILSSELAYCNNLSVLNLSSIGTTGHSINSDHLKNMPLTYINLSTLGTTGHSINSDHLKNMQLTSIQLALLGTTGHSINSDHLKNMPLTYINLSTLGTTGHTINTSHFANMQLTYFRINLLGTTGHTGTIADLPATLTTLTISGCGTGISISNGTMKAWNANITLTSGYSTASVDGFLNAYAAVAPSSAKTIDLKGVGAGIANENRSTASDAAVTTLQGLLKTVLTNP